MLEAEETRKGKRRCCILGIVNNTKEGVVIELSGGRNGLIKGNTISKLQSSSKGAAMIKHP